jgi:hypothetical protein
MNQMNKALRGIALDHDVSSVEFRNAMRRLIAVNFQEVVHSVPAVKADVAKRQ